MGIFNAFGAMSGQFAAKQERLLVAKRLLEELQLPGMIAELVASFKSNGVRFLFFPWSAGQTTPAIAEEFQQCLKNSTLMNDLVRKTNMPVGVVKASLAILLPLTTHQLTTTGNITPDGEASEHPLTDIDKLIQALG